jgi:hypothetical protein
MFLGYFSVTAVFQCTFWMWYIVYSDLFHALLTRIYGMHLYVSIYMIIYLYNVSTIYCIKFHLYPWKESKATVHEVWSKISGTNFFYRETTNGIEVTTTQDTWQHLLTPHTRGADGSLTRSWVSWSTVQSCLSLCRIVKWMCWRSNVFPSSSARNLVRRPQKRAKCYNKHSEKQRWVSPRHLSGIPDLKMAAHPSTITDRLLWCGGSGPSRVSSQRPDHESDCLYNCSATPLRCSSSETASQMVFWYLVSAPRQCIMPHGTEC